VSLTGLPHNSNGRSTTLAQRLVDRLSAEPGVLGEFDLELSKRPQDAAPTVALDWGRPLWVVDYPVATLGRELTTVEVTGIEHDITPEVGWRAKLLVDRWVGATPSTPAPQPVGAFSDAFARGFDGAQI
jgi:hypothetical protein